VQLNQWDRKVRDESMKHREINVEGIGGLPLFAQAWVPDSPPTAVVVVAHGLGEHSSRYQSLAERLVADGRAVYAIDHRGHGRSGGRRANIERFAHVVSDFCTFAGRAARQHPGTPLFLFGHSMGGAIAFASAARLQDSLNGLVLSGPALAAGDAVPAFKLAMARLLSVVAPNTGAMKLPASAVSRDPAVVSAYEADPLVMHDSIPARTLVELLQAMATFPALAKQLRLPLLIQHGTADLLVPLAAARDVHQAIASKDRTFRPYDGLYHEIYNAPDRDQVIGDLLKWLARHAASG
jgi:alpha-beta hydrolase superfamily lysophospholipase